MRKIRLQVVGKFQRVKITLDCEECFIFLYESWGKADTHWIDLDQLNKVAHSHQCRR